MVRTIHFLYTCLIHVKPNHLKDLNQLRDHMMTTITGFLRLVFAQLIILVHVQLYLGLSLEGLLSSLMQEACQDHQQTQRSFDQDLFEKHFFRQRL